MRRITEKDLESLVKSINTIAGTPLESYSLDDKSGRYEPNANNYHLDSAYGGHCLVQLCEGGGCRTITSGFVSKRDLYEQLQAYRSGLMAGKVVK